MALTHENIATTSQNYGRVELEAKRELQRRLVEFVKQRAAEEGWKPETPFDLAATTSSSTIQ